MKKTIFSLAAIVLVLAGCTKEQSKLESLTGIDNQLNEGALRVSFEAIMENATDADTKASISTSNGLFSWDDKDVIAIQLTNNKFKAFQYSSTDEQFSASLDPATETIKEGGLAYYPASLIMSASEITAGVSAVKASPTTVNLPNSYSASESASGFPMISTVDKGNKKLYFYHLGGLLSVKASYVPADATKLILTIPVDENEGDNKGKSIKISGDFTVTEVSSKNQISAGSVSGANTVTLTFTAGVYGTSATEFFIPVPVTTFAQGFSIDFKNASNESLFNKSTAKTTISVARAAMKRMSEVTVPKYVYVRNATTWDGTIYAHMWGKNKSNEEVNLGGWTATPLSDCTSFTHDGETYYRLSLPTGITGNANLIIHANDDFMRTDNHASVPSIPITQDTYLTAEDYTPATIRVYIIDESKWTNGTVDAWYDGGSTIVGASINSLSEKSMNNKSYRYFDANSKTTLKIEFKANWDGEYSGGHLTHSNVSKDLVYYWKGKNNDASGNWYYLSEYTIAKVTIDSTE